MGNYASCALAGAAAGKSSRAAKVVLPGGDIRTLKEPMKAAELMLETPNFFLVNARSLQIGRRFAALNADEDLEIGSVYVFFPMKRLNSVVAAADMGALFMAAKKKGKVRVVPEVAVQGEDEEAPPARLKLEELAEELCLPEFSHRRSVCRSKKPVLDTILEEPICVR
ncbi:hypothetical protein V2J09_012626 [Rumex salicifolius]